MDRRCTKLPKLLPAPLLVVSQLGLGVSLYLQVCLFQGCLILGWPLSAMCAAPSPIKVGHSLCSDGWALMGQSQLMLGPSLGFFWCCQGVITVLSLDSIPAVCLALLVLETQPSQSKQAVMGAQTIKLGIQQRPGGGGLFV